MDTKKVEKPVRIVNSVPPEKRAVGVKLPGKNPTLVARADANENKLPLNLREVFEKIQSKGKAGEKIRTLFPRTTPANRYRWWLIRTLVKMEYVKAIGEPKDLSIAKAAKKTTIKKPNNKLAQVA